MISHTVELKQSQYFLIILIVLQILYPKHKHQLYLLKLKNGIHHKQFELFSYLLMAWEQLDATNLLSHHGQQSYIIQIHN